LDSVVRGFVIFRGIFMPIIDYAVLYSVLLPLVLNTFIPEAYVLALVPSFILHNLTSTLYAVPIAYIIAKRASSYLKIEPSIICELHQNKEISLIPI
jgi:hypothetical protein